MYPAYIGETGYAAIKDAVAAIADGTASGEILVKGNVAENVEIPAGAEVVLNIPEGAAVSGVSSHTIANHGVLTIKGGGTIENAIKGKGAIANYPGAVLNLGGCTVTGNTWYVIKNLGTMVINGANMVQNDAGSSAIANGYYGNTGNDLGLEADGSNYPSLTINSGSFSGGMNTVKNDDYGVLVINGGSFTNTAGPAVLNWNEATINDGTFTVSDSAPSVVANGYLGTADKGLLTINGGTFTAAGDGTGAILGYPIGTAQGGSTTFAGGTFNGSLDVNEDYPCAPIVLPNATINPPEGDTSAEQYKAMFEVDGKYYMSLGEAVAAVPADNTQTTVKLLRDAAGGGAKVKEGQNIIFDFGGHTYTVGSPTVGSTGTETNGFQLLKGSTVTMRDGVVKASTYKDLMILIQNYCGVRLENLTLDASAAPQCMYALSNNCGSTVVTGSSNIYAAPGQRAFDLWYNLGGRYEEGVSLTFDENFTGRVEGIVEYGAHTPKEGWIDNTALVIRNGSFENMNIVPASNDVTADAANVTIYGGTFDEAFNENYAAEGLEMKQNPDGSYGVTTASYAVSLSFDPGEGKDAPAAINAEVLHGDSFTATIPSAVPTRTGYVFKNWTDAAGGSYKPGDAYTLANVTADAALTLSAVWEEAPMVKYTLSYDANGGKDAPKAQSAESNTGSVKMTLSKSAPTREGWTFAGWSTYKTGSVMFRPGDNVEIKGDVTLYALWVSPSTAPKTGDDSGIALWATLALLSLAAVSTAVFTLKKKGSSK